MEGGGNVALMAERTAKNSSSSKRSTNRRSAKQDDTTEQTAVSPQKQVVIGARTSDVPGQYEVVRKLSNRGVEVMFRATSREAAESKLREHVDFMEHQGMDVVERPFNRFHDED